MSVTDGTFTVTRGPLSAEGNFAVALGSTPDSPFIPPSGPHLLPGRPGAGVQA